MDSTDGGLSVLEGVILCIVVVIFAVLVVHALNAPLDQPGALSTRP